MFYKALGIVTHTNLCQMHDFRKQFLTLCDMYGAVNSTLSSLALDSSRGLLYFTDPGRGTLGVLSTDGFADSPNVLIAGANQKPTAIAVDSTNRHFMLYLIRITILLILLN